MKDQFIDRMNAQRIVLKQINKISWPSESLLSLSEDAIQRWLSVNQLGEDDEVVKLAKEAGDALMFLANASQEQVSPQYASRNANMAMILDRTRLVVRTRLSSVFP